MSRYTDIFPRALPLTSPSYLSIVDWSKVGASPPTPISFPYKGPKSMPPRADIIVMTWTGAEWAATDHVFLRSSVAQGSSARVPVNQWYLFGNGAPSSGADNPLWGYYQLVKIRGAGKASHRVLLFKSDAHLAHNPWMSGLTNELEDLISTVGASRFYSIGTAGGANEQEYLGDVVITNCAKLQLQHKENLDSGQNGKMFSCDSWFPSTTELLPQVQKKLFYKLKQIVTTQRLTEILDSAKRSGSGRSLEPFSLNDLLNSALDPANLGSPKALSMKDTPELTADYYYIAPGNTPYAAMDMDDAVIAEVAGKMKIEYAFIRNISDTLVPAKTGGGTAICDDAREAWSSAIYDHFGVFTSLNSALATWATIADS
jgi:hypothetical protein